METAAYHEKTLFHMINHMLDGEHFLHRTENGLIVANAHSPIWVATSKCSDTSDISTLFRAFLAENPYPITAIVAKKNIAITCADIICKEKRVYKERELVAYYLPNNRTTNLNKKNRACKLRLAGSDDILVVQKWLDYFYKETLDASSPEHSTDKPSTPYSGKMELFILADPHPVAMGSLSGSGDTLRLNLIYTAKGERRKGYGSIVVSSLADFAHQKGKSAMLYAFSDNTAANKLYIKLGFIEAGRLSEIRFHSALSIN